MKFRSDNAGCYHSACLLSALPDIGKRVGIQVLGVDFSEKQAGKDICDRKFAQAKNRMRKYVVGGSDILDAVTMHTALVTGVGKTMDACVCEVQPENQTLNKASINKISFLSNFQYEQFGIRCWKAHGVGRGRVFSRDIVSSESQQATGLKVLEPFVDPFQLSASVRAASGDTQEDQEIFSCSECTLAFGKVEAYEQHRDLGCTQKMTVEERAKRTWANLRTLDPGPTEPSAHSAATAAGHSKLTLPAMGWALKVSKPAQKMTDKVLEYLTEIFDSGVKTGKQRDATDVAREMKVLEDDNRERVFSREERLNKQQIFSFWSRLKAQRKLDVASTASVNAGMNGDIEDIDAAAMAIEENNMAESVAIQHPITVFGENLCNLIKLNRLQDLKLEVLRKLILDLGLDLSARAHGKSCIKKLIEFVQEECPVCSSC